MEGCKTCDGSGYVTLFTSRERCPECERLERFQAELATLAQELGEDWLDKAAKAWRLSEIAPSIIVS